ncbi:MAG: InlB B-repeat-containing protein, partial [Bacillota bacterium]
MRGGTISGNTAGTGYYGSGVYNAGTFNMSGGTISGNISSAGGGGVSNVGTMTMSGGTISGNTSSSSGGGILNSGVLEVSGGSITNNTTGGNGGGISMSGDSAIVTLSGTVSITGNIAGGSGGGIYCNKETLCIEGAVSIINNLSGAGVSNIYIVDGQAITVTGDITGQIGVAYEAGSGVIAVADYGYTITDEVTAVFSPDNTKYYAVLNAEGSTITLYNEDDIVTETSEKTITYDTDGYSVSDLIDIASSYNAEYTLTTTSGEAVLDGETLNVTTVGTFVLNAKAAATSTTTAKKWELTLTVEPMEVYVSGIEALSRGVNENNIYVDLDESTGVIKDANGDAIDGISIDFSSAYGVIDDEYYYNDETLLGDEAHNNFSVTIENIKLSGENSANYAIASVEATDVDIYSGYPLVSWATVSNITYGDTMTNDSLLGGKVIVFDGETEEYITVSGSFAWVETPVLESVGSYSYAIQFVVDENASNYSAIADYVEDIEPLIHYVNYDINADAVTFSISDNVLALDSSSEPTITASASGVTVDEADYTILYFKVDDGVKYYSFDADSNGDGSYENPYLIDTSIADSYLIGAELSENYHHSGTVENTAKQIGVLYVGITPDAYSVTFNNASGAEITSFTIDDSYLNSIIIMPEYGGGIGWVNAKGVFYEFGDRYPQTAYDETFTLVSVADSVTIKGTVSGTDLDGTSGTLDGVMVQLMQGSEVIDTMITDSNGAYSFSVAEGNYTLVVTRKLTGLTNIVSVMVDATESSQNVDVTLPETRQNVVLEVDSGFTGITVDGLDSLVPEDEENTITVSVDSAETNGVEQTAILALAAESGYTTSNVKLYFDINFTEQPSSTEVAMTSIDYSITFIIPLAGIYQHKDTYIVYVYDDYGNVYELDTNSYTCDGETLTITTDTAGVYALAFVTTIETFEGDDKTETYSANEISLSDMFDDKTVDIKDATYTIGENSTGVGYIDGNTLIVDKVGDFEIIITTKETATAYSYIGAATLTVDPATITITDVSGVDRGLIEDNVVVDLNTTAASLDGAIAGDDVTLNFDNAYGAIVASKDSTTYYYDYDQDASAWTEQKADFYVLIVGATLEGYDSANYVLAISYTDVTITTSEPYIAWPTATSILYGQDLSDSTLYGGTVVIYDGGNYVEFSTDDCNFEWVDEANYTDNFNSKVSISELSAGSYTQQVKVSIKTTASGYDAEYNTALAAYTYYVTFEIVADAVEFVVSDNIFEIDSVITLSDLSIEANTSSGAEISASDYEIVFFKVDNGVVYYSLSGSVYGDGSYGNPYLLTSDSEGTYLIGALFSYSDGVYNYHHSGSADSTAKQIGTLYITNSSIATYTTIFMVDDTTETAKTGVISGDILILPTLDSANYIGWEYAGVVYDFGARFTQPSNNVVFTAVAAPTTYAVSGTVIGLALGVDSGDPTAIGGVGVALYQGSELVATTTTDATGTYTFNVAVGNYSLVITRTQGIENIITKYLSVEDDTTVDTIEIPNIRQNTVVSVDTGVGSVTVGGINDLHTDEEENTYTVTIADGSSEVGMLAEMQTVAAEDGIDNDEMKVFLNIAISDDSGNITELGENMLTFYIELAGMYQGYDSYYVYRYHTAGDGTVTIDKITTEENANGEYLAISKDGTTLILNVSNFSLFGIAFENEYDVSFGDVSTAYTNGTVITAPADPTQDETTEYTYTFKEWNTEADGSGTAFVEGATATSDVTYYAIFTESSREYTITLNIDGTTIAFDSSYGSTISVTAPTKATDAQYTYTFAGWSTSNGGDVVDLATVSGDVTYYAVFTTTTNSYKITFGDNGSTLAYGTTITAPTTDPTKDTTAAGYEYIFDCWNTSEDGSGAAFIAGTTVSNSETYYAIFNYVAIEYAITYVNFDNTSSLLQKYTIESETITFIAPAKEGYAVALDTTSIAKGSTGNKTVTATYTAIEYDDESDSDDEVTGGGDVTDDESDSDDEVTGG